ncbi:MAG: hypothetical protein AAGF20_00225 [Pseudomonadota bacterium]
MKTGLAVLATIALAGCATGYKPLGFSGGYSEVPLAADTYQVSYRANAYTKPDRAQEMTLLRCAELADEAGYAYFVIRSVEDQSRTSSYTTGGSSTTRTYGSANAYQYGSSASAYGSSTSRTTYSPPQVHNIYKPGVGMIVQFIPDQFAEEVRALSVSQVYGLYAEKYGLEGGS